MFIRCFGCNVEAQVMKEAGPTTDPWTTLALIYATEEVTPWNRVAHENLFIHVCVHVRVSCV